MLQRTGLARYWTCVMKMLCRDFFNLVGRIEEYRVRKYIVWELVPLRKRYYRRNRNLNCPSSISVTCRSHGRKFSSINSVDSWGDDDHFQFSMASVAAFRSKGFPPIGFVDLTVPLGATTTSTFTVPRICIRRAKSG